MGDDPSDEELKEIACYSIEVWNTLCEEEAGDKRNNLMKVT